MRIYVPVRIEPEMNRRDHWTKRRRRFDGQRMALRTVCSHHRAALGAAASHLAAGGAVVVTLTRVGPRTLDTDNLASGFKACRDEIASLLGVDDGSSMVEWIYRQERGRPFAMWMEIETR
jgi:aspartate oxidase